MGEIDSSNIKENVDREEVLINTIGLYFLFKPEAPYEERMHDWQPIFKKSKLTIERFYGAIEALIDSRFAEYNTDNNTYKLTYVGTEYFSSINNLQLKKVISLYKMF